MLHLLKRLHLWWIRVGEGRLVSRTITLIGSVATLGAVWFHQYAFSHSEDVANRISVALAWIFGGITLLELLRAVSLWKRWPWQKVHPAGKLNLLYLPPEPDQSSAYRFHLADSVHQLKPFVDESEYFLGEANPDLTRAARMALYERWLRCNKHAFVYLTKSDRACPVALSIVLPLTKCGYERLYGKVRPLKKVIDFDKEEIASKGPYKYLLIDTFIVSKRQERIHVDKPLANRRYGRTLILRHLALFWRDIGLPVPHGQEARSHSMVIIAETDKERLKGDLAVIGFKEKGRSGIGCPLYEFRYPLENADAVRTKVVGELIKNIGTVRKWGLEMKVRLK